MLDDRSGTFRKFASLLCGLLVASATACGGPSATSGSGDDRADDCTPGRIVTCTCSSGRESRKQCRDDGSWSACDCESSDTTIDAGMSSPPDTADAVPDVADAGSADASWLAPSDRERTLVAKRLADDESAVIDGELTEAGWSPSMERTLTDDSGDSDNRTSIHALWDDQRLYVALSVRDDTLAAPSDLDIWRRDSVEIFVDTERDRGSDHLRPDDYHILVDTEGQTLVTTGTSDGKREVDLSGLETEVAETDDGYRVELSVPNEAIGLEPSEGQRLGFLFANNDRENGARHAYAWGQFDTFTTPSKWGDLRLGGTSDTGAPDDEEDASSPEPEPYDTIVVPANSEKTLSVGDGETLENLLVDVTAEKADFHISARGDGWTIRDVGIKGKFSIGDGSAGGPAGESQIIDTQGDGLIENVYLGDGVEWGLDKTAMIVDEDHAGHIEVRNAYVAEWSTNAIYAAGFGRIRPPGKTDGAGGTIAFRNSYFRDNDVAHLRLAADGTVIEGSVFHNTNKTPPVPKTAGGDSGVINSRGIYTGYGDPQQVIEVHDSHFEITEANTCNPSREYSACAASVAVSGDHDTYGELSTVRLIDSHIKGRLVGDHVETQNVGHNPDLSIPEGVPETPKAAARGL